mmetsp:Transcript_61961/g.145272  ORF Transcript_61961/g.145272 Transcript_61961/m.145272 type:complete len:87 (+) Transcript_61961:1034-1294(+)
MHFFQKSLIVLTRTVLQNAKQGAVGWDLRKLKAFLRYPPLGAPGTLEARGAPRWLVRKLEIALTSTCSVWKEGTRRALAVQCLAGT